MSLVNVKTGATREVGGSSPSLGRMALVAQLVECTCRSPLTGLFGERLKRGLHKSVRVAYNSLGLVVGRQFLSNYTL